MSYRGCRYSADSFCYVCGEFFAKKAKKHCLSKCIRATEAYHAYFTMPVGDQDKRWAPHVIRECCRRTLEGWLRGKKEPCALLFLVSGVNLPITTLPLSAWWTHQNGEMGKTPFVFNTLTSRPPLQRCRITPATYLYQIHLQKLSKW